MSRISVTRSAVADDPLVGAPPGKDQLDRRRSGPDQTENVLHVDEAEADGHVYLIEDHEVIATGKERLSGLLHALLRGVDVLFRRLSGDAEAMAEPPHRDKIDEALEGLMLTCPLFLDELAYEDPHPCPGGPERKPEGRCCLALAVPVYTCT